MASIAHQTVSGVVARIIQPPTVLLEETVPVTDADPQSTMPAGVPFSTDEPAVRPSPPDAIENDAEMSLAMLSESCFNMNDDLNDIPISDNIFTIFNSYKGIKVIHLNIQSLLSKFDEFSKLVVDNKFDAVSLNETWLTNNITDDEISIDGYDLFRCDRDGRGGGAAIYVRESFKATFVTELLSRELECVWVKLIIGNRKLLLGSCYRKPSASVVYLENIIKNLQEALSLNIFTLLLGDFNLNYSNQNSNNSADAIELCCQMKQLITEPTRVTPTSSSIIDLIYTSDTSFHSHSGVLYTTLSDHYSVYTVINFKHTPSPGRTIQIRLYDNIDVQAFVNDLNNCDIFTIEPSCISSECALVKHWQKWISQLNNIVNLHAPLREIRVKNRFNPWFNDEIQHAIYKRNYYHNKAIRKKDIDSWHSYRSSRNYVTYLIRKCKSEYYHSSIITNKHNLKQMWKTLNHVLPSGSQQKSTSYDFSPDEFNTYFSSIGSHLESNFNSDIDMPALDVSFTESFSFGVIPISFITEELLKLRKKSSPDVLGLSGSILSIAAHVISPSLQVLFCKS